MIVRRITRTLLVAAFALLTGVDARCRADDAVFLRELRRRGLDELFAAYCQGRLADPDLAEPTRVLIGTEYALHLAQRATQAADADERERRWQSAHAQLAQLRSAVNDPAQRQYVRFVSASLDLFRGQWLRQAAELQGQSLSADGEAAKLLTQARTEFEQLSKELTKPTARRPPVASPPAAVAGGLAGNALFRLALSEYELAQVYPPGRSDRRRLFESAAGRLAPMIPTSRDKSAKPDRTESGADTIFHAANTMTVIYRLLGRYEEAVKLLNQLDAWPLTADERDEATAERIELSLAQNNPIGALDVFDQTVGLARSEMDPRRTSPRLQYLLIRILLEQARSLKDKPETSGKLQASALFRLRQLQREHPGAWSRRAELVVGEFALELTGQSASALAQAAEGLVRAGRWAEAAALYRQAADDAVASKRERDVTTLMLEAARNYERARRDSDALAAYARLTQQFPNDPRAPEALLRAALCAERIYRTANRPADRQQLLDLLLIHLKTYPTDPTSGEIRFLLGDLYRADGRFGDAVEQLLSVASNHWLFARALLEASRTYEVWAAPVVDDSVIEAAADSPFHQAAAFHEKLATGGKSELMTPAQWSEVLVRRARYLLDPRRGQTGPAVDSLQDVLRSTSLPPEIAWQARRYLVVGLIKLDRLADADRLLQSFTTAPIAEVLTTLQALNHAAHALPEVTGRAAAGAAQVLVETLESRRAEISAGDVPAAGLAQAVATVQLGDAAKTALALRQLEKLRATEPRNAQVRQAQARALMQLGRYEESIIEWRSLIAGLRKESPMWYRAQLQLTIALRRAGKKDEANRLLRVLEVLHPDLGGPILRARFAEEKRQLAPP